MVEEFEGKVGDLGVSGLVSEASFLPS